MSSIVGGRASALRPVTDDWNPRTTITKPTAITKLHTNRRRCSASKCGRFMVSFFRHSVAILRVAAPISHMTADRAGCRGSVQYPMTLMDTQFNGRVVAGRYQLGPRRGSGVDAAVFDAFDLVEQRVVAIKVVHPDLSSGEGFERAFRMAAEQGASIKHPNIAEIYDWGADIWNHRKAMYVIVEHLSGGSLREYLDRGRTLSPSQALMVGLRLGALTRSKVRDPRLIALRRGGTLSDADHHLLAVWAADCAEHVLPLFERERPGDERPRRAIEAARAWARGEVQMMEARAAGGHAMAAARDLKGGARYTAFAAGRLALWRMCRPRPMRGCLCDQGCARRRRGICRSTRARLAA